jgi:hypothetical protein
LGLVLVFLVGADYIAIQQLPVTIAIIRPPVHLADPGGLVDSLHIASCTCLQHWSAGASYAATPKS